jgi:hypothetical protein
VAKYFFQFLSFSLASLCVRLGHDILFVKKFLWVIWEKGFHWGGIIKELIAKPAKN